MNTGPHSPARASLAAEMRKAAVKDWNSQGMERPDIPCPPLYESTHRLACSGTLRFGGSVGKAPNLFDGRWHIEALGQQWLRGTGRDYLFQHQPITPVRRLAGCDAAAWKARRLGQVDGR